MSDEKTTPSAQDDGAEYRLPRPSLRIPMLLMIGAGIAFGALATRMSDVGHATGSAIGALVFLFAAAYIALLSRRS